MYIDEVPHSRDADRVPVAWRANERRDVTRIILCGPDSAAWNLQGRKPNPFAPRRAAIIEIKAGVVHQDRKPAANQHHDKKKIEEVTVAYPNGKAMRPDEVVRVYLRNSWNARHPGNREFYPCSHECEEDRDSDPDQDGWSNPDAKTSIRRIMNSLMRGIEPNHPYLHELPVRSNPLVGVLYLTEASNSTARGKRTLFSRCTCW